MYISLPHFLHGSPELAEPIEGLSQIEREEHGTCLDVEPVSKYLYFIDQICFCLFCFVLVFIF